MLGYLGDAGVRALTHDESKAQSLEDQGIEVVIGDLSKPDDTLGLALEGVDRIFLLAPGGRTNLPSRAI